MKHLTDKELREAAEKEYPYKYHVGHSHSDPHRIFVDAQREAYIQGYKACQEESKWIPVSERLPERGRYACWVEETEDLGSSKYVWNCYFGGTEYGWADNGEKLNVTHWMPLPEPPKM